MSATPVRVAVTGAAGQIGYSLVFRIASGQLLGPDQPVILQLLEIPPAMGALEGVAMEIDDCAFPLIDSMVLSDDPNTAFDGAGVALLVGSRPRTKGMERKDLLEANGAIFTVQGRALNDHADDLVRHVLSNVKCQIETRVSGRSHRQPSQSLAASSSSCAPGSEPPVSDCISEAINVSSEPPANLPARVLDRL